MSGHSKWNNIKHKKMAGDDKKGKVFTKHAKLIAVAARGNPDISTNAILKAAIDNAKAVNVPNDNIERAIKKGAGEDKNAATFEEIVYEAFGPGGVSLLIQTLTDNKNRALGNIKVILGKKGGRLADAGSVAWMFKKVGVIFLELSDEELKNREEVELEMIDLGVEELEIDGNMVKIVTTPDEFGRVRNALAESGYTVDNSAMVFQAANEVELPEEEPSFTALQNLVEALECEDDVDEVFTSLA
jgi:YebC/PmpR family DNA-binding regulatory protein